jgi:hypothetical protein
VSFLLPQHLEQQPQTGRLERDAQQLAARQHKLDPRWLRRPLYLH